MIGNETILGQIATFMESLHLSYHETVAVIPYRNLLLMQRDKLHAVYGEKIQECSGRDMLDRKGCK